MYTIKNRKPWSYIHAQQKSLSHPATRLSRDAQGRVESISGSLARSSISGGGGIVAGADGVGRGLAFGLQLPADETGDDLDVEGAAVVEVSRVGGGERLLLAAVEAGGELNGRVAAGPEVQVVVLAGLAQLAELLCAGGGVALVLCCRES